MTTPARWIPTLCAALALCGALAAEASLLGGDDAKKAAEPPKPTIRQALSDVGVISAELKIIEKRLAALEQSVAGLDKSLAGIDRSVAPLGAAVKPESLKALVNDAGEVAYAQARSLILLATACGAGLLVLFFVLRRFAGK